MTRPLPLHVSLVCTLIAFLYLSNTLFVFAEQGLGISKYAVNEVMKPNTVKTVPVGRIYNTGDETLDLNINVEQTFGVGKIDFTAVPSNVLLKVDRSTLINVEVNTAGAIYGTYGFEVQVVPTVGEMEGNPVIPVQTIAGKIVVTGQIPIYFPGLTLKITEMPDHVEKTIFEPTFQVTLNLASQGLADDATINFWLTDSENRRIHESSGKTEGSSVTVAVPIPSTEGEYTFHAEANVMLLMSNVASKQFSVSVGLLCKIADTLSSLSQLNSVRIIGVIIIIIVITLVYVYLSSEK